MGFQVFQEKEKQADRAEHGYDKEAPEMFPVVEDQGHNRQQSRDLEGNSETRRDDVIQGFNHSLVAFLSANHSFLFSKQRIFFSRTLPG